MLGFFDPANADQALLTLDMMDFDGKEEIMQQVEAKGTLARQMARWQQLALGLAQKYEPELAEGLAAAVTGERTPHQSASLTASPRGEALRGRRPKAQLSREKREKISLDGAKKKETKRIKEARKRANEASQPK